MGAGGLTTRLPPGAAFLPPLMDGAMSHEHEILNELGALRRDVNRILAALGLLGSRAEAKRLAAEARAEARQIKQRGLTAIRAHRTSNEAFR